jgi:hypothetical protein
MGGGGAVTDGAILLNIFHVAIFVRLFLVKVNFKSV